MKNIKSFEAEKCATAKTGGLLKKLLCAAAAAALVLGVLALAGCAAGSTSNDMEITQVIYVRTGGDMDKADVYVIRPD
ncbi:MAG: hypothetical protein IJ131_05690, partial [Eggerthellaceae bacterium]|nr:hypothetical protein [Eggerthellaceae bacterium]